MIPRRAPQSKTPAAERFVRAQPGAGFRSERLLGKVRPGMAVVDYTGSRSSRRSCARRGRNHGRVHDHAAASSQRSSDAAEGPLMEMMRRPAHW
jgi:hypothetical protein